MKSGVIVTYPPHLVTYEMAIYRQLTKHPERQNIPLRGDFPRRSISVRSTLSRGPKKVATGVHQKVS